MVAPQIRVPPGTSYCPTQVADLPASSVPSIGGVGGTSGTILSFTAIQSKSTGFSPTLVTTTW